MVEHFPQTGKSHHHHHSDIWNNSSSSHSNYTNNYHRCYRYCCYYHYNASYFRSNVTDTVGLALKPMIKQLLLSLLELLLLLPLQQISSRWNEHKQKSMTSYKRFWFNQEFIQSTENTVWSGREHQRAHRSWAMRWCKGFAFLLLLVLAAVMICL